MSRVGTRAHGLGFHISNSNCSLLVERTVTDSCVPVRTQVILPLFLARGDRPPSLAIQDRDTRLPRRFVSS